MVALVQECQKKTPRSVVAPAFPVQRRQFLVHEVRDVHRRHAGLYQVLLAREVRNGQSFSWFRPNSKHLIRS